MEKTDTRPAWKEFQLPLLIIIAVSLAVYSNTLGNGFVFDDNDQILGNPWIKDAKYLPQIFTTNTWAFAVGSGSSNYYRPMMHVFYMLAYLIFGLKPWGYHLLNIILHACSSVLVFLIARALFDEKRVPSKPLSVPLMAGVLFALHPVHTEAVAWAAGIPDLSYAFFCLLSLHLYMKSDDRFSAGYYFSVTAFFVAALCKEPALTLPALLLAYDLLQNNEGRKDLIFFLKRYAPFFLAASAYVGLRFFALGGSTVLQSASHPERGLYDLLVLIETYIKKLAVPVNLQFLYSFKPAVSLFEAPVPAAVLLIGLVLAISYAVFRTNRPAFFCLLIIAAPLLPCFYLNAISGPSLIAERYLYLPSAGFAMLVAYVIGRISNTRGRVVAASVFFSLAVIFSAGTLFRNADWKDDYSLWTDTVKKSPASADAHDNLGLVYARSGRDDLARDEFLTALKGYPIAENAYKHLGVLYGKQGMVDDSIEALQESLKVKANDPEAHNELGIQYSNKGQIREAAEEFQAALNLDPARTMYRGNLEKALQEIRMSGAGGR